ncbi:MAG: zinc ribbon domain-containing protein [Propionibacteriaceae bacterium]|nr:zinc ribbon domain-containing protein [Propionibacteriaceae bacterium]
MNCTQCGAQIDSGQFCGSCGAPAPAPAAAAQPVAPVGGYAPPAPGFGQPQPAMAGYGAPRAMPSLALPEIMLIVMAGLSLLGFIFIWLPVKTVKHSTMGIDLGALGAMSYNSFSAGVLPLITAILAIIGFLALIALAAVIIFVKMDVLKPWAGLAGVVVGGLIALGYIISLIVILVGGTKNPLDEYGLGDYGIDISDYYQIKTGMGFSLPILIILGLGIAAAGVILMLDKTGYGMPQGSGAGRTGMYMPPMGGVPQAPGMPPATPMAPPATPMAPPAAPMVPPVAPPAAPPTPPAG